MTTLAETLFNLAKQFDLETNYAHLSWDQLDNTRKYMYMRVAREMEKAVMMRRPDSVKEVRLSVMGGGGGSSHPANYAQGMRALSTEEMADMYQQQAMGMQNVYRNPSYQVNQWRPLTQAELEGMYRQAARGIRNNHGG